MEARWIEVDDYFAALFAPEDAALAAALAPLTPAPMTATAKERPSSSVRGRRIRLTFPSHPAHRQCPGLQRQIVW